MVATRVETKSGTIYTFSPAGPVTRVQKSSKNFTEEGILEGVVELETGKPFVVTVRLADFSNSQDPKQTVEEVYWRSSPVTKIQILN